jgi:acetyl esterase/lipase
MKMLFQSLLLAGILITAACAKEDTTVDNTDDNTTTAASVQKDVAYASVSSAQKMDIYMPEGDGPFPLVILIHGGAFLGGSKSDEASNAAVLNAAGYVAVSINYRLSSEAKFPAQIEDCKAAVRFLRANASTYKINSEKIGSWGASAGGNLSALLGTTGNVKELEGSSLGNETYSSAILASVDWFGPINFLTMDAEAVALGFSINTNSSTSPESKLMGAAVQTIPDAVAKANPSSYITTDDAAFFIQAGSADRNIPYTQSRNFYQALAPVKGSDASFELLEGAGHGGSQFSASANLAKVIAFFDKYLK